MANVKAKLGLSAGYVLLAVASVVASLFLVHSYHPLGGLSPSFSADSAKAMAAAVAESLGVRTEGLEIRAVLSLNSDLIRQVSRSRGLEEGNRLLRDSLPGYYWQVSWLDRASTDRVAVRGESDRERGRRGGAEPEGPAEVQFDMRGNLLGFRRAITDSGRTVSLSADEARLVAEDVLRRFSPRLAENQISRLGRPEVQETRGTRGNDYRVEWTVVEPVLGDSVDMVVWLAGNRPVSLEYAFSVPPAETDSSRLYRQILYGVFLILIAVSMVIMAVRRIRAYELGFRMGIGVAVFGAITLGISVYTRTPTVFTFEMVWGLVLAPIMFGLALAVIWAVAESLGRESFREKFVTLDLLANGHLFHSRVGASVLRGIGLGAFLNLLWLVAILCAAHLYPVWFSSGGEEHAALLGYDAVGLLSRGLWGTVLPLAVLIVYALSLLRKWMPAPVLIGTGAVIFGFTSSSPIGPTAIGLLVDVVVAAGLVVVFLRSDVLATFLAMVTLTVSSSLAVLLVSADPAMAATGERLLVFGGIGVVLGLASVLTRDRPVDLDAITPAFSRHITERERLRQELEIARTVQKSLLPKKEPAFAGLDIASRCVPAAEVGGDYYDFVSVSPDRLAVVVGDVSGKGTEGAFYMTLAKGFLKAVARASESPAKILEQANSLFFENVERGNFISVVYGVFDRAARTVTIARAGHNPVIVVRGGTKETEIVQPSGMALGLEPGEVFRRTIGEVTLPYGDGDVFVFYTDGFGEAANREGDEFGQDRLASAVRGLSTGPAAAILEGVLGEVRRFVGRTNQRDDMTMVVVKC